ncbi:MAG: DNA double-strand break repair nuclease NurA [Anaerolineae bacterium]|nr:DNA double-strand break repair nuclease NurA [Anaerolineae bacterium]
MPVDLLQAQKQIKEKSQKAGLKLSELKQRIDQASELLKASANEIERLTERVEKALAKNIGLRCAVPCCEPLDQTTPAKNIPGAHVILAADGSQIAPSRHDRVEFGVINTGVFRMEAGGSFPKPPDEIIHSRLLFGDDLEYKGRKVTEDLIALWRDLDERRVLAELAAQEDLPVVALTDGPLELYQEPKQQEEFASLFQDYLLELGKLAALGVVTAGYVEKPRADLVVKLLELATLKEEDLEQAGHFHPFGGVTDLDLFKPLLEPGERSALFRLQSVSAKNYEGELGLYFYYLKSGSRERSTLARVEIPAWVARDPERIERAHAVLVRQCEQMGNRPYPYALHRAHEIAVVHREEKQALEDMIVAELYRLGIRVGEESNKQVHKENSGSRTRYTR